MLEDFASPTPSRWRGNAISRLENSRWLRRSQKIAMEMLDRMDFWGVNQKELAQRKGCTPQYENPSPSRDPWFDDPENMASVRRGIEEMKAGKGRAYTMDEIRTLLGV